MFRILGILVVALLLVLLLSVYVNRQCVRPTLRRRHLAELEEEDDRWDHLIEHRNDPQPSHKENRPQ